MVKYLYLLGGSVVAGIIATFMVMSGYLFVSRTDFLPFLAIVLAGGVLAVVVSSAIRYWFQ